MNNGTAKTEVIHQCKLKLAHVDDGDDDELSRDSNEYEDASDLSYVSDKDLSLHTAPFHTVIQSSNGDDSDDSSEAVRTHSYSTKPMT